MEVDFFYRTSIGTLERGRGNDGMDETFITVMG